MAAVVFLLTLCVTYFMTAHGNYFFTTHDTYTSSSYGIPAESVITIAGDATSVMQQCRRRCLLKNNCRACKVTLLQGGLSLGAFECQLFNLNAYNWNAITIRRISSAPFSRLWEKLEAALFKPKACIEYCAVKYSGNCTACRGYEVLKGLDCEEAPQLCSGYSTMPSNSTWSRLPVWPWGIYGKPLQVLCRGRETMLITTDIDTSGNRILQSLGLAGQQVVGNSTSFLAVMQQIDWELISELQSLSEKKMLIVYLNLGSGIGKVVYNFTGFELGPSGELSLNASISSPPSTGFPVPLYKKPFVKMPQNYASTCGPFWLLEQGVPVCQAQTNLFTFGSIKWDGITPTNYRGFAALTFI